MTVCSSDEDSPCVSLHLYSVIRAAVVDMRPALIQLHCQAEGYYPLIHRGRGGGGGGRPDSCSTAANSYKESALEIGLGCNYPK